MSSNGIAAITGPKTSSRTIESVGLTRRFDYDRYKDMYTSFAYA